MAEKQNITFDPDEWTLGDLDDFESIAGVTLDEALTPTTVRGPRGDVEKNERGKPIKAVRMSAKVMLAIVYISLRKDDPALTIEAAKQIKVGALVMGGDDSPEEQSAAPAS